METTIDVNRLVAFVKGGDFSVSCKASKGRLPSFAGKAFLLLEPIHIRGAPRPFQNHGIAVCDPSELGALPDIPSFAAHVWKENNEM